MPTWQEFMAGPAWPRTFERWGEVPVEVKVEIVKIALRQAIEENVNREAWKYDLAA